MRVWVWIATNPCHSRARHRRPEKREPSIMTRCCIIIARDRPRVPSHAHEHDIHTNKYTHKHTRARAHTHTCARSRARSPTRTYIHAHTNTSAHTHTPVEVLTGDDNGRTSVDAPVAALWLEPFLGEQLCFVMSLVMAGGSEAGRPPVWTTSSAKCLHCVVMLGYIKKSFVIAVP